MKKSFILLVIFLLAELAGAQRKMENLGRGLVAVKIENGVYLNWRITGQEWRGTSYNIYRDGIKINDAPITGASNYIDTGGALTSKYKVSSINSGLEQTSNAEVTVLPQARINIKMKEIPKIAGVSDSYYNQYTINDVVAGDLDGDGEYELIVKRLNEGFDPNNPFENKYYTLFDAYKLDGTFLWRIDVGPNIFNNVEINAFVFDLDGDGKAEVVMRTSEGTVDAKGNVIGDLGNSEGASIPDGITNYRNYLQNNSSWYEFKGPEYLSLFNGETGEMLDRIDIIARQPVSQWGTSGTGDAGLAHRATKFHYGAPYLDGKKPSLLVTRGIYYRIKMATYDIVNKKFSPRWTFDSGTGAYASQGNHNYSIADVDNDGRDEIVYGSMTVDDDGKGLYSTGLGHGDAIHVGDFDPYRKGLEVFACLENSPVWGTSFRKAENGEELYHYTHGSDCGRCMAANVSNSFAGAELWPGTNGVYSASERRITSLPGGSVNFRIFWDGDLLDELVDHNFNSSTGKGVGFVQKLVGSSWQNLLTTTGYYSCNYTKGTPCLQADLFGDWREELIYRNDDESEIAIFMTTIPTDYRIYTLMHDMQYRQAIGWQMCGYNQPPHVSYFLGEKEGITVPPPPVMDNQKLVFVPSSSTQWGVGSNNWTKDGVATALQNGDDILFDVSGHADNIKLTGTVSPRSLTVNSPNDYVFDLGSGKLSGDMAFVKQGKGKLFINGSHDYSGKTEIWDGFVSLKGQLQNSPVWLNLFAELSAKGAISKGITLNYGAVLYPGGKESLDTLNVAEGNVELKSNSVVQFDLGDNLQSDKLILNNGTLTIADGVTFDIHLLTSSLQLGEFILAQTPNLQGDLSKVTISGLDGKITSLSYVDGKVVLTVMGTRSSGSVVWTGKNTGSVWDFAEAYNFLLNGTETFFVAGDDVTFDDSAVSKVVNLSGSVTPSSITVGTDDAYTFQGAGTISGATSLTKIGSGKLTMKGQHDFMGGTYVKSGTLAVESMPYLASNGSIGQKSDNPELFVLDGGTLTTAGAAIISERALKMGAAGGTINANANIDWKAVISGTTLTKTGSYTLALYNSNSFSKLILQGGAVALSAEAANPGKTVSLYNGTVLRCYDNSSSYSTASWNIEVPENASGTINLDSRCNYTGTLTGAGILTLMSPWIRSYLNGNWSAFTGKIIATSDTDGGDLSFNNNFGLPNAELAVNGKLYVYNNAGSSFNLGALSGTTDASLGGNVAWTIGNKNLTTTFNGVIATGSISKVGTGTLILTNANTYTGGTIVSGGRILAQNTTGSPLGTGPSYVNNGAVLGGTAIISGAAYVRAGGTIEPGNHTVTTWSQKIGSLTFNGGLNLASGSNVNISVRNLGTYPSDLITVNGGFSVSGTLTVEIVSGDAAFPLGAKLKIFELSGATVSGNFTSYNLPPTDSNTSWDTSKLLVDGTIEVVSGSSGISSGEYHSFRITPNPADDYVVVSDEQLSGKLFQISFIKLDGGVAYASEATAGEKINISHLLGGAYIVKIESEGKTLFAKLLKK